MGKQSILLEKGFFPCSVDELFQRIKCAYKLHNVDSQTVISGIAVDDKSFTSEMLYIDHNNSIEELKKVSEKGIAAVVTDSKIDGIPYIKVDYVWDFALKTIRAMLDLINLPTVIVCGSEGKTTTKRLVNSVLSTQKKVYCQYGNYNVSLGLCCNLPEVEEGTEIIVRETDESGKTSLLNSSLAIRPKIALVTNIAEAHLAIHGSKEALIESFRGVTAGMDENGIVIINRDDEDSVKAKFDKKVISVGIYDKKADCIAENIKEGRKGVVFDVVYEGKRQHIKLSVHGEHNIYNAMMAYVVGRIEGISIENIKKGLFSFTNSGIRQNICKYRFVTVYADCYNASATSVRYAIKCFDSLRSPFRKKAAIIGDIAEIEGFEEDTYRRIAESIDESSIDILVTFGSDSQMIHSFVKRDMVKKHFTDIDELNAYIESIKKSCGSYLFKASRVMKLERCIKKEFPNHYHIMMNQEKNK